VAGLLLHLKLELVVSSCEKSANEVMKKVAECANTLNKNVCWLDLLVFYLKAITIMIIFTVDVIVCYASGNVANSCLRSFIVICNENEKPEECLRERV